MGSLPVFHELFFVLSLLFSIQTPMIAETAEVRIDFAEQNGSITYERLVTAPSAEAQAQEAVRRLGEAASFGRAVDGISLSHTRFRRVDGNLHGTVVFTYEDRGQMLSTLGFVVDGEGYVVFPVRERETVRRSNGRQADGEVSWDSGTEEINLRLAAEVLETDERARAVNLGDSR